MDWPKILQDTVGWIANIIQIATAVFAFVVVVRTRRKLNKLLRPDVTDNSDQRRVAIVVSMRGSIRGAVEQHFKDEHIENIQVFEVTRPGDIDRRQTYALLREISHLKQTLTENGVNHVDLFYRGPVTLAMGIGSLLDNWVPVIAYDYHDGIYEPILRLGKGAVFDIMDELLEEGEQVIIDRTFEG
jgi:hypothetical protein